MTSQTMPKETFQTAILLSDAGNGKRSFKGEKKIVVVAMFCYFVVM
jgi:hypothetical protein